MKIEELDLTLISNFDREKPFFIFSLQEITAQVEEVRGIFPGTKLNYSIKANPHRRIVNHLEKIVDGFDLSSRNELEYLCHLGVPGSRITLSGPGKTDSCLEAAICRSIKAIHVDSVQEWKIIYDQISVKNKKTPTKLALRIQAEDQFSKKLGLNESEIQEIFSAKGSYRFSGLHAYLGRESFTYEKLTKLIKKMEALIDDQRHHFDINPKLYIGLGLSREPLVKASRTWESKYQLEFEIGRKLVSSCGFYGAPVLAVKPTDDGNQFVIINGGLQHLGSPLVESHKAMNTLKPRVLCDGKSIEQSSDIQESRLAGSLCLWHDILHPRIEVPRSLRRGDILLFSNCGAYGLTAGIAQFIGQDLPQEFVIDETGNVFRSSLEALSYHRSFSLDKFEKG
jgi:diaminopimelate decarboxylase